MLLHSLTEKKKYYIWSNVGTITFIDKDGKQVVKEGVMYDSYTCVHKIGSKVKVPTPTLLVM